MKSYSTYLRARHQTILSILHKPKQSYTAKTFHQLRVELKKLNALVRIINFCAKDFNQNRLSKPYKLIFLQAGRVRALQVEEAMIAASFPDEWLVGYKKKLKERRRKEQELFFNIANKKCLVRLEKNYQKIRPFLHQINKKKVNHFRNGKIHKIKHLLEQTPFQPQHTHELRKRLKLYFFAHGNAEQQVQRSLVSKNKSFIDLLGRWHDCDVIIAHLDKEMRRGGIAAKELDQFQKTREKFSLDRELLSREINLAIPDLDLAKVCY